jgi:hypothetical protein
VAAFIAAVAVLRYLTLIMTYLAITFPAVRRLPVFNQLDLRLLPAPWWLLIEAHIVLLFLLGVASVVYHLLPALEAHREGIDHPPPAAHIHAPLVTPARYEGDRILRTQSGRADPGGGRIAG